MPDEPSTPEICDRPSPAQDSRRRSLTQNRAAVPLLAVYWRRPGPGQVVVHPGVDGGSWSREDRGKARGTCSILVHVYRGVLRNLIVLAHNMVIVPFGIAAFLLPVDWNLLMVLPALCILALNGVWISLLLGMVSARFRDVPPIITTIMQALFFFTPVIWPVAALKEWQIVAAMNPFFAAVDVLRAPLIGAATADSSWPMLLATTIIGFVITFAVFTRFRTRIPYWI